MAPRQDFEYISVPSTSTLVHIQVTISATVLVNRELSNLTVFLVSCVPSWHRLSWARTTDSSFSSSWHFFLASWASLHFSNTVDRTKLSFAETLSTYRAAPDMRNIMQQNLLSKGTYRHTHSIWPLVEVTSVQSAPWNTYFPAIIRLAH